MKINPLIEPNNSILLKGEPIVVVCAADDCYAMPLTVVARSALEHLNCDRKMLLFVIDGGIKEANKQKLLKSLDLDRCQVKFIPKPNSWLGEIEETLKQLRAIMPEAEKHILSASGVAYYRLFIPELLPLNLERAIYLDCDLVVKGDLEQLWQSDFQDNYVLAVQDLWGPYVSSPITGLPYQELGISADSKYFNSGLLVINLQKWRADGMTTQAIDYLKQYFKYVRAQDQGVLNAVLANRWGQLDPRWNLTPAIIDLFSSWQDSPFSQKIYNQLVNEPYIMHFATDRKPWNSRHTPFKDAFFDYVDMTAWSGWRLTFWRRLKIKLAREFRNIFKRLT
jgi:lipopolysaccharide biosynthesis glycosyltransferase